MPDVKVRRTGIRADQASAAIKDALGPGYEVTQTGERAIEVRKNAFIRAKVNMTEEPGGTTPGQPVLIFLSHSWGAVQA